MSPIFLVVLCLLSAATTRAQNHAPTVSNVQAAQRHDTSLVDITYDVADPDGDSLIIVVTISGDSGHSFRLNSTAFSGDIGFGIRPGTGKRITWDAGADLPGQYGAGYQVKVLAHDTPVVNDGYGDYMLVPAGPFQMGDNWNDLHPSGNTALGERPVHIVFLNAYYVGKHEVTNGEYKKFLDDGSYSNVAWWDAGGFGLYGSEPAAWRVASRWGGGLPGNEEFPVLGVSWFEAMAYSRWLSAKTGNMYRLPTEAEWEKAARGVDQHRFPWGQFINESLANFLHSLDPYSEGPTPTGYYDGTAHGSFITRSNASPYGACDMAGNAAEWCYDWYDGFYYNVSPAHNPSGPVTPTVTITIGGDTLVTRSGRGGSYSGDPWNLRAAYRVGNMPQSRSWTFGFRCVREP